MQLRTLKLDVHQCKNRTKKSSHTPQQLNASGPMSARGCWFHTEKPTQALQITLKSNSPVGLEGQTFFSFWVAQKDGTRAAQNWPNATPNTTIRAVEHSQDDSRTQQPVLPLHTMPPPALCKHGLEAPSPLTSDNGPPGLFPSSSPSPWHCPDAS